MAEANANAVNAGLHAHIAYRLAGPRVYLEPALEFDVNYLTLDGYHEHGDTPFDLRVGNTHDWVLSVTPGLKLGARLDPGGGGALDLYASAGASFLHGNSFDSQASFATVSSGAGGFRTRLDNGNVAARLTAGVQLFTARRFDIQLQYEGRLSNRQTDHGGQAKATYRF